MQKDSKSSSDSTVSVIPTEEISVCKYLSPSECRDFECEKDGYAEFILNEDEAQKLQADGTSVTYIFKFKEQVVGYVTLAMGSLHRSRLEESDRGAHRFAKIPCLLLGQMARHRKYAGEGIGTRMTNFVFDFAKELSEEVGCRLVIVDAEKDRVVHYQRYFNFQPLPYDEDDETVTMYFDLKQDSDARAQL